MSWWNTEFSAQELELLLKEDKDSSALTQETLQGQLDQEHKMAAMHKRIADESTRKVAELSGIVQQFREHLQACLLPECYMATNWLSCICKAAADSIFPVSL